MKYFFPKRKLTTSEFFLIPEGLWELFTARIKVSLLPSQKYLPLASNSPIIILSHKKIKTGKTIAAVINGLSARTPWASTCLVQVLALHKMLLKRKIPHSLHFGIKKNSTLAFEAHAWLSLNREIVIGNTDLQLFKEISQISI
jgi:Transglutaminase-like superfamily